MNGLAHFFGDRRKSRLFAPIVALTLAILAALVLLSAFLLARFDTSAAERERHVVSNGLKRQIVELNGAVATQVNWDDAISNLDHRFSRSWADFNVGSYLFTFEGFTHSFAVDGEGIPFYAAVKGESAPLAGYDKFASVAKRLIPIVRAGEVRRGPVKERSGKDNILVPPIQADAFAVIHGQVFIVTATLVQPDFGKVKPKGARAPVVIAAVPIDRAFLANFSNRYLLDGFELLDLSEAEERSTRIVLAGLDGTPIAALAWRERAPGTQLLKELAVPIGLVLLLLCLLALSVVRRGANMVSDLFNSEARAKHLAFHDPLTRLPNRAMLFERLNVMLADCEKPGQGIAVLCIDLDRFKDVNDLLGHHAGDVLIAAIADRLRALCTEGGLVARLGGDEFVVLARTSNSQEAERMAELILAAVRKPVESEYGRIETGCSIGYVLVDRPGVEASEALRWADLALYRSKERGRMCSTRFEPAMDAALRNRRSLEADLREALDRGSLRMVYQPQVNRAGEVTGTEALLRWFHPQRGEVSPGIFVPLAEESGLILKLGEFVLRTVFAETSGWRDVRVAINVSAVQMRSPGFAALLTRLAARAGADPTRYEIELTETALLDDDPVIAANVEALKRLGFSLALDDFGTGYSSLAILQRFAVDKLKIDRSFVSELGAACEAEALVFAMIRLARALSLKVIAEGVETEDQKSRLVACGCDEFQGHLTGMPMPAAEIEDLLDQGRESLPRVASLR